MAKDNIQPLDEAVGQTIEQARQAIEQTRTEIARSQALGQVEADLAQSIERIAEDQDGPTRDRSAGALP